MSGPPEMAKVFSTRDGWGPLILHPGIFTSRGHVPKREENWEKDKTNGYRGPILIHKGKVPDPAFYSEREQRFVRSSALPECMSRLLPFGYPEWMNEVCGRHAGQGGIIGSAIVEDVVQVSESPWYVPGTYAMILSNPQPLPFYPTRGYPWIFEIPYAPFFDHVKSHCWCCETLLYSSLEEDEGWLGCHCSIKQCSVCRRCQEHCLCEILFPDLSALEPARKTFNDYLKMEILS